MLYSEEIIEQFEKEFYKPFVKAIAQILVFSTGCPFLLYVIYQNATSKHYYVQSVAIKKGSFSLRKSLKKEWQGQSQEELLKLSGIKDIVFCHRSGFLGGTESLESAIKMAEISKEAQEQK